MMAPVGYVGLKNLGSTCYMNSLMQQFFMMPHFRYGLLMAASALQDQEDQQAVAQRDEPKSDSLLYQFQALLGFLSFSEKQSYDTTPFCLTYKDENGQPVNVRIQQDAQEFFNVLVDRLEKRLKSSPMQHLFRRIFGGTVINQLVCHGGCGSIRESSEDFYTLSLEVKGKNDLIDSLTSYGMKSFTACACCLGGWRGLTRTLVATLILAYSPDTCVSVRR